MTVEEAIKVLEREKQCVQRDCDRECLHCDLVMQAEDILTAYDFSIAAILEHQAAGRNEPLTLDELREMEGEPVWYKSLIASFLDSWGIVMDADTVETYTTYAYCDEYGKTWVAYRNKPKGATE